jgi:hypothetical protein
VNIFEAGERRFANEAVLGLAGLLGGFVELEATANAEADSLRE